MGGTPAVLAHHRPPDHSASEIRSMAFKSIPQANRFRFPPTKAPSFGAPEKPPSSPPLPTKRRGRPRKYPDKVHWPEDVWDIANPAWTAVWRAWRAVIIAEKRRANVAKAREAKLKTQPPPIARASH
jgi:hypothetical protein